MRKILVLVLLGFSLLYGEDLKLDIMFTNDIHGGIDRYPATFMNPEFPPYLGGGAAAASYIGNVRKLTDHATRDNLLVDAGDFFQGHPIGTVTDGAAVIKYMNMVGYDLLTIGNHEYDIPFDRLQKTLSLAKFPILSCNTIDKKTGELASYVRPYVIMEKLGVKIGILGLTTTETAYMSFPENIKNITFESEKTALEKYVPLVKKAGADIIILVGHFGLPYDPEPAYKERYDDPTKEYKPRYDSYDALDIAHQVNGIDLIVGGHMHKGFAKPWVDPYTHTMVIQGYAMGSNIGHLILKIDKATKTVSGYEFPSDDGLLVTLFDDEFLPAPVISDSLNKWQAEAEKGMDEVLGIAENNLTREGNDAQNKIGNFVCDAMRYAGNADFSFINLGGVRSDIPAGPITYRQIFDVMPFDNMLVIMNIPGRKLKEIVEMRVSGTRHGLRTSEGSEIVYNRLKPDYERITTFKINGKTIEPDKIYRVATTDFLMQGNAGLTILTKIPESQQEHLEMTLRDAMAKYVKDKKRVSAEIDSRWQRDDGAVKDSDLF